MKKLLRQSKVLETRFELLEKRQLLASDWQNAVLPADVDQSAFVSPLDALIVINRLNRVGSGMLPVRDFNSMEPFYDVDGDGFLSPQDVLVIINAINKSREPMGLVAGVSPASDPNGNGVVLGPIVILNGQSLPGIALDVKSLSSTDPSVRVIADEIGKFSVSMPVQHGIQTLRLTAMDEIGRTLSVDVVVRQGDVIQDWNAAALNIIRE